METWNLAEESGLIKAHFCGIKIVTISCDYISAIISVSFLFAM